MANLPLEATSYSITYSISRQRTNRDINRPLHVNVNQWTGFWNGPGGVSEWFPPHKPDPVWSCGGIRPGGHAYDAYNAYRCPQMPTGNI